MANTERLNTLQYVLDALKAVAAKQQKIKDQDSDEYQALQRASIALSSAQDDLVYEDMKDVVDDIEKTVKKLNAIVDEMKNELQGLTAVANTIDKAASALGTLAEIVSKAATAGIL